MQKFQFNDGGRADAGFVGGVSDCVTRALAIHTGRPYEWVRSLVLSLAPDAETVGVNVFSAEFEELVREKFGLVYVPMRYAMRLAEFPELYGFMVLTKNHVSTVSVGVVQDVFDCGNELARGYWIVGFDHFDVIDVNGVKLNKNGSLNLAQAIKMRDMMYLNYKRKTWII